ncbi:NAD(P)H-binding protein [Xanthomarina spongicola]|uniref:NAD-dependent epimerase/dehydratase family protein n=1 Tax=Xanthomarina spongicola TaxID=570520 RepID=A0A316DR42_9FLAO|nr:NAD(P)H-binding protein [Xanthomarina spongicola]PWK20494.1 NAD-dependent epimerase/dehydratase family protein [Xanthomarina spongicola]
MSKTAIILGATGLTGGLLLEQLLIDSRYSKIILFSRTSCNIKHVKIEEHIVDLLDLTSYKDIFLADEVFCCIGTTKAKTPNEEHYLQIDFGIPVMAAQLCKENDINTFIVVSSLGADKHSTIFYNRTKGRMEEAVLLEKIPSTYILQPSLIGGDRNEKRVGEFIAKLFMKILNPLLFGSLSKYKSIHPITIAKSMVILANSSHPSGRIVSNDIKKLVKNND